MANEDMIKEVLSRLVRIEGDVTETLQRVASTETKIDDYNNLREKLSKTYGITKQNQKDITEIKDNTKWLWRTIAGTIIIGIISAIIKFG